MQRHSLTPLLLFLMLFCTTDGAVRATWRFLSSPGVLTADEGRTVTLKWSVSRFATKRFYSIQLVYHSPDPVVLLEWLFYNGDFIPPYTLSDENKKRASGRATNGSKEIVFYLHNVKPEYIEYNYACEIVLMTRQKKVDKNAWIILLGKPVTTINVYSIDNREKYPYIGPNTPLMEYWNIGFACSGYSIITAPKGMWSPQYANMTFTWKRDGKDIPYHDGRHKREGLTLLITPITRVDFGKKYSCIGSVEGSKLKEEAGMSLNIFWSATWNKTYPATKTQKAAVGQKVHFNVWAEARPKLEESDWHWRYTRINSPFIKDKNPDNVLLRVSGNRAVLVFPSVTTQHYGYYYVWAANAHGGWNDTGLVFHLEPPFSGMLAIKGAGIGVGLLVVLILIAIGIRSLKKKSGLLSSLLPGSRGNYERIDKTLGEIPLQKDMDLFSTRNIDMKSVICRGDFYQIWNGTLKVSRNQSTDVVIKKLKQHNPVYMKYLESQGQYMWTLRRREHSIACIGMSSDKSLLLMEKATMGNLKEYLKENKSSIRSSGMDFIHQIMAGVHAVHQLQPPALFYCLSASHVLLSDGKQCKLTGFASARAVKAREKWEEDKKLKRPIQWLAPEAIKLNHTDASDIWSLGILMWEIFSPGRLPLGDISDREARIKILSGRKPSKPLQLDRLYDIMLQCWLLDPLSRPSLQDIELKCEDFAQESYH